MTLTDKQKEYGESYSNLAYAIAGFIAYAIHSEVLVLFLFVNLSVSSYIFHWYKTKPIYLMDWWAMALMNVGLAGYHFDVKIVWTILFLLVLIYGYMIMGKYSVYLEVAITSVLGIVAIAINTSILNTVIIVAIFALALFIRSKDIDPKQAIFHDSVYHSVWHVLTAFGYYVAFYPIL